MNCIQKQRKKCLLILPRPIFPLVSGYSLKNYHLVQILAKEYKLTAAVISEKPLPDEEWEFYKKKQIECLELILPKWKSVWKLCAGLFTDRPLQVSYYFDTGIKKKLVPYIEKSQICIAALIRTRMYLDDYDMDEKNVHDKRIVMDMVDAISVHYRRSQKESKSFIWRILYGIEAKRLEIYEKKWILDSDITYLFNQNECRQMEQYGKVKWLPHGVNPELFTYSKTNAMYQKSVTFIGKMNYKPNVEAVLWYLTHVQSRIGTQIPLVIVGAYPTKEVINAANQQPNVTVTGYVEDPYEILNSSLAVVAPMQTGGGIQNKVLEGMALGKINLVSSLAAEPIVGAEDKKHLLIADTAEEYIQYLKKIWENREIYEPVEENARKYIRENYTWEKYGREYIDGINK